MSKYHNAPKGDTGSGKPDSEKLLAARAALAKHGVQMPDTNNHGNRTEFLSARNEVRRVVNTLTTEAQKAIDRGDMSASDSILAEIEGCSLIVNTLQKHLDNNEFAKAAFSDPSASHEGLKPLRSQADFEAHYGRNSRDSEGFTLTEWMRGVANLKTSTAVRNALSVGTDTAGGFTVPSRVMPGILGALAPASSLMIAGMGLVPLEDGAKTFTTAVVDTIPTAAWRLESGAIADSDPAFRGVVATPRSLSFKFKVSRELLMDSPNMNEALNLVIAQAFAKEIDRAGLRGTGTAPEPRGLSNTSGIQTVTNGANGASLTGYTNLFSAVQAIMQANGPMPTAAIMSPRSLVKLGGLLDTTNQPLNVPPMLQGVQQIGTSQIPNTLTVGTSTDCTEIYVGNFTNMAAMLRENLSIQLLTELYAATGEIGFVAHARVDFAVMYPAAFALVTGVRA